nr:aminodeoxychorismate lyase [Luteibacter sp. Sphag1AF]
MAAEVSARDRGLLYGDGLFETIRVVRGAAPLWHRHEQRLIEGCRRLRIPCPDVGEVRDALKTLVGGWDDATARLTVTRGEGTRGYAIPPASLPGVFLSAEPSRLPSADDYRNGVAVRLCDLKLAQQPALAGLKHLNRLEQVLARSEWSDASVTEGLLLDGDGRLVCATAANIFAVFGDDIVTPPVERCGVAGVARAEVLALAGARVADLNLDRLRDADEVFLTSAVRGILPVRVFEARQWQPGSVVRRLQAHWGDLGLPLPGVAQGLTE